MASIIYKEWLPDQPALGNPGLLRAENVLPLDSGYGPFLPLDQTLGTITQSSVAGAFAAVGETKGSQYIYALAGLDYYMGNAGTTFVTRGAASSAGSIERFAQYENLVIAVGGHTPNRHTVGSASGFTALAASGYAPEADVVSVINQFVILGNLTGTAGSTAYSNYIQWSAIDQPTNWPAPNSSTAIATQSGEQVMPLEFGGVMAIHGGDQHGVVLQHKGVSRMTYVGPPVVFQFDVIDKTQGCNFANGSVQVGQITYFISARGFCRTDGVQVENIGAGIVDRFFWNRVINSNQINAGYDPIKGLVYFAFPTSVSTYCDSLLIFNPRNNRWTYARQALKLLVTPAPGQGTAPSPLMGFATAGGINEFGIFNATAGTAIIETGEVQFIEAGRTYLDGVKPNVESSATAPAITCRIGYRDSLATTPSYTTTASAYSRTGIVNARVDAKYIRVETQIVGNFDKAIGIEADPQPSGYA